MDFLLTKPLDKIQATPQILQSGSWALQASSTSPGGTLQLPRFGPSFRFLDALQEPWFLPRFLLTPKTPLAEF